MSALAIHTSGLAEHPAARAWRTLYPAAPEPVSVEEWRGPETRKSQIYRLTFASAPSVFGKLCAGAVLEIERTIYQDILPHLQLTGPRCFGFADAGDDRAVLFLEDVGNVELSPHDAEHRALAARWLGLLHSRGADLEAARRLRDVGLTRYLDHLRAGRRRIRENLGNPAMTREDRAVLTQMIDRLDGLEARWDLVERASVGLPVTVVHGDFRPKNVRVRSEPESLVLHAVDWEMAGWGVPAIDLAPGRGPDRPLLLDLDHYLAVMRERWPELDAPAVRRLWLLGYLFRQIAGTDWSSTSLRFESQLYLIEPVGSIQSYLGHLALGIEALGWPS